MTDLSTRLIHHPYQPPPGFAAPQPGVFKASTIFFTSVENMRASYRDVVDKHSYTYGLRGTPTSYLLEERLCALEGGSGCLLTPSGLAAIALVSTSLLKSGDEVLIPSNCYGPTKDLCEGELKDWGITHQVYDPMAPSDLEARISSRTKLVWIEAAGSVTLEFPNLVELVRLARRRRVTTALDNTWGAGLAFSPFDLAPDGSEALGVDVSIQALTKYPSGGADVLMGSVITRDAELHKRLTMTHRRLGIGVGANDVEAVLRSLPSMTLRYSAHDVATRVLAQWAQAQPEFAQVLHPALADAPGHAYWRALCSDLPGHAAGLFSVMLGPQYSQTKVEAFCEALQLFKIGYSWGGPVSLVMPYTLSSMRATWPAHLREGTLVRFSIGLESAADLQADLQQALARLH